MRLIETDTSTNKDINTAVSVGAYTATATRGVIVRLLADQVAGGGDYIAYVTVQLAGAGSHYRIIPITTAAAAAALTAIGYVSLPIPVDTGDVLTVYIDGLAGDTTTPDVRVDFYEQDYLRPTVAGRTLDVSATGEADANITQIAGQTVTAAAGVTFPASVGNSTFAGGAVASVTGDVGGKVLGGGASVLAGVGVQADVTQLDSDPTPLDNLVLSLGQTDGIVAHPQGLRDAMKLAPTAGAPADGSIDDHLDDVAAALAAATSTLTVVSAVDGDVITIYQAVSCQATISGLAIPAAWTKLYFTVKSDPSQTDADAIIQMVETATPAGTDGLLRLNGAAGTAANGTLTVSQATGTVVIDLVDDTTAVLALATGLHWSLKALYSTSASILLAKGTLNVRGQATAAMS